MSQFTVSQTVESIVLLINENCLLVTKTRFPGRLSKQKLKYKEPYNVQKLIKNYSHTLVHMHNYWQMFVTHRPMSFIFNVQLLLNTKNILMVLWNC
jgi:hypothetical protein